MNNLVAVYLYSIDPLRKNLFFFISVSLTLTCAIFLYLILHPPAGLYLLTTVIVVEVACFMFDDPLDKCIGIIMASVLFAASIFLYAIINSFNGSPPTIMLYSLFCFLSLLLALIKPQFRKVVCIVIAISAMHFAYPSNIYTAQNATINAFTMCLISIAINMPLIFYRQKNLIRYTVNGLLKCHQQQLSLCYNCLFNQTPIAKHYIADLDHYENEIRLNQWRLLANQPLLIKQNKKSQIIASDRFRSCITTLNSTLTALLHHLQTKTTYLSDDPLARSVFMDMALRFERISETLKSAKQVKYHSDNDIYKKLKTKWHEEPNSLNMRETAFYFFNLHNDLLNLERCFFSSQKDT